MARDDDNFWLDIFRKSPLIATFMALGGLIGLGIGIYFFVDPRLISLRLILCLLFSSFCGGCFVGLIVGVIIDTVVGATRGKKKKKRRDDYTTHY
jgi:hypothetical protein